MPRDDVGRADAAFLHGIALGWTQFGVVARLMPGPTSSKEAREGNNAESPLVPSILTRQSDEAAFANNELTGDRAPRGQS